MKFSLDKLVILPLIYLFALPLIDFAFKDYNDRNEYEISSSTYIIIFLIVLLIVLGFVLKNSQETDRFIKSAKGFALGVFFGFISVVYIGHVKNQTSHYLNKLLPQKMIEEDFAITYRHVEKDNKLVGLRGITSNYWFGTKNKFSEENLIYIQKNDTITIEYGIGLLNKPFLPSGKLEIVK